MQLAETRHQISSEQVQIRDIAELYLRIQENTEFLTNIVRHQHGRAYRLFSHDIPNIQIKSFFNLIVQSAYLLYTCYVRKVAVYFSKNLFVAFQKQGGTQIIIQFLLEKQFIRYDEEKKRQLISNFVYINTYKYDNAYAQSVLGLIKQYLYTVRQYMKKQKQKKMLSDRYVNRQLQSLDNAFGLLCSISQKGIKPKSLISCLEQTQVFRTYSYLLKTLNSSLYETIRKSGKFQQIIQEIKRKQFIFNQGFNLIIRQNIQQTQSLESCMQDFIHFLIQKNLIEMQVSVKSKSNSIQSVKDKSQAVKIGFAQVSKNGKPDERVYVWKILVEQKKMRDFNQKILLQLTQGQTTTLFSSQNQKKLQNSFHIQYMAKRNLISVIYISNIQVNIQNSDAILYHCSNISLQLSNVIVQHIQKQSTKGNKRKERVIGFKVVQHLNSKQNPFINIMLLIDRAMIIGKVCQPEIQRKVTKIEDGSKFNIVGKRINHLSSLFIKKVRRLYENIGLKGKQI